MKLLLDEMWPPAIAIQLRNRGHDVVAVLEREDLKRQPDATIFATAQMEGSVIVTENVGDFRALTTYALRRGGSHSGMIFTTNRRYPRHDPRTAGHLVTALDALLRESHDLINQEHWLD